MAADELPEADGLAAAWPGLRRVVAMEAIRSIEHPAPNVPQGVSGQIGYYLTSSAAPEARIAAAVRAHWAIENRLHWVLDTGTGRAPFAGARPQRRRRPRRAPADRPQPRAGSCGLARAGTSRPGSLKGKRNWASWDDAFMHRLLAA